MRFLEWSIVAPENRAKIPHSGEEAQANFGRKVLRHVGKIRHHSRKNSAKKEVRNGTVKPAYHGDSSASGDHKMANGSASGKSASAKEAIESVEDDEEFEAATSYVDVFTIGGYVTLQLFGYLRDFLRRWKVGTQSGGAGRRETRDLCRFTGGSIKFEIFRLCWRLVNGFLLYKMFSILFVTEVYRKAAKVSAIDVNSQVFFTDQRILQPLNQSINQSINRSVDRTAFRQVSKIPFMQFTHGRRALESFNFHCAIFCRYISF